MMQGVVFTERAESQLDALIEQDSGNVTAESFTGEIVSFCLGLPWCRSRNLSIWNFDG